MSKQYGYSTKSKRIPNTKAAVHSELVNVYCSARTTSLLG